MRIFYGGLVALVVALSLSAPLAHSESEPPIGVANHLILGRIGYIQINGFTTGGEADVDHGFRDMLRAQSYIIDLRSTSDNNGDAVRALAIFARMVNHGPLGFCAWGEPVSGKYRLRWWVTNSGLRQEGDWDTGPICFPRQPNLTWSSTTLANKPMIALVDGGTSPLGELVAAALQDNHRALILGTKTAGNGAIILAPWLTAQLYRPNGKPIQGLGVTPDIIVPRPGMADLQLRAAISQLR